MQHNAHMVKLQSERMARTVRDHNVLSQHILAGAHLGGELSVAFLQIILHQIVGPAREQTLRGRGYAQFFSR